VNRLETLNFSISLEIQKVEVTFRLKSEKVERIRMPINCFSVNL